MTVSSLVLFARKWRFFIAILALIGIGGYFYLERGAQLGATLTISASDFREQVSVSGTVTAAQDVALGFAANGRIAGTYGRVGQHIEAGTVIAEIENGDLVAVLAQKQAALKEAQANLASLKAGTRSEEVAVAATAVVNAQAVLMDAIRTAYSVADDAVHNRADTIFTNPRTAQPKLVFPVSNASLRTTVEQDRATIEPLLAQWAALITALSNENVAASAKQAQTYAARITTLLVDANLAVNQGVPDQNTSAAMLASYGAALATARTNMSSAATTLTANAAALDAAQSTLVLKQSGSTPEALAAQEAAVAAAEADIRSAAAQLAKTRIVAPFSGTITRMDAKVGEIVSPSTSLISLQSDGIFQIETYVPEVVIARIAPRNPATTTLDAYGPSIPFPSIVVSVDPAETVKDGVPTYKTILSFLARDERIRSGMTANVMIETGLLPNAIVIPAGAVGTKGGTRYVSVIEKEKVTARSVTLGPSPALGQAYITSGLTEGEVILLAPLP